MNRTEIENKVRDFLIEDLEVDEEKSIPMPALKKTWALTVSTS